MLCLDFYASFSYMNIYLPVQCVFLIFNIRFFSHFVNVVIAVSLYTTMQEAGTLQR